MITEISGAREQSVHTTTLRRVGQIFLPYWRRSVLVVVIILTTTGLNAVNPIVTGLIIDSAFPHKDLTLLTLLVLVLIGTSCLYWTIYLAQGYLKASIGQRVMHDLRIILYTKMQGMSLRFYTATRTGEILSRLSNDVNGVESVVTDTFTNILVNVATVLITLVILLRLNALLTLAFLCLFPFFIWLTKWRGKISRSVSTQRQQAMADVSTMLEETLNVSGALLSKSFGRQCLTIEQFAATNERLMVAQMRQVLSVWTQLQDLVPCLRLFPEYLVGLRPSSFEA